MKKYLKSCMTNIKEVKWHPRFLGLLWDPRVPFSFLLQVVFCTSLASSSDRNTATPFSVLQNQVLELATMFKGSSPDSVCCRFQCGRLNASAISGDPARVRMRASRRAPSSRSRPSGTSSTTCASSSARPTPTPAAV